VGADPVEQPNERLPLGGAAQQPRRTDRAHGQRRA
jgi:hypothetical protein